MGVGLRCRIEVLVRFPGKDKAPEAIQFDAARPLEDQLAGLCQLRDVPYNQDENYQVLVGTGGSSGSSAGIVLASMKSLSDLPARPTCELRPAVEVAHAQLSRIDGASRSLGDPVRRANLKAALGLLLRSMRESTWFAEEVVAQDGLQVLLDALVLAAPREEKDASLVEEAKEAAVSRLALAELAASCLGELLQYENGVSWCEQNSEQLGHKEVFTALLESVLAVRTSTGAAIPKAALGLAFFLLADLPGIAASGFHMAGSADEGALYRRLVQACLAQPATWCSNAAAALLSAVLEAAQESQHSVPAVEGAVQNAASHQDATGFIASLLGEGPLEHQGRWIQHLLSDTLTSNSHTACQSLEVEAARAYSAKMAQKAEQGMKQDSRCRILEGRLQRIQEELRRTHLAMRSMTRLVDLGDHPYLRDNLDAMVRTGFDSILWEKGYTALHYAAEAVQDLNVLEMICHFASNLDVPDDEGLRPKDCAERAGHREAAALLERLQQQRGEPQQEAPARPPACSTSGRPGLPPSHTTTSLGSGEQGDTSFVGNLKKKPSVTFKDLPPTASQATQASRTDGPTTLRWASGFVPGAAAGEEEYNQPLRELARQLRGYLFKKPSSGSMFGSTRRRYFAMTVVPTPPPGAPAPHFEFGYWESDVAFRDGAVAKGSINARQITEISTKGLSEASVHIVYKDGANAKELIVMATDERGLPCARDAQRWADQLREFCKGLETTFSAGVASVPPPPPTGTLKSYSAGAAHVARAADTASKAPPSRTSEVRASRGMTSSSPQHSPSGSPTLPSNPWAEVDKDVDPGTVALPLDTVKRRRRSSGGKAPRGQQVKVRFNRHLSGSDSPSRKSGERLDSSFSYDPTEDGYTSDPGPGQPAYFRMNSANSIATTVLSDHQPESFNIASINGQPNVFRISSVRSTFEQDESDADSQPPTSSMERLYQDSWVLAEKQPRIASVHSTERLYEDTSWLDIACASWRSGQQHAREAGAEDRVAGGCELPPTASIHPIFTPAAAAGSELGQAPFGSVLRGETPRPSELTLGTSSAQVRGRDPGPASVQASPGHDDHQDKSAGGGTSPATAMPSTRDGYSAECCTPSAADPELVLGQGRQEVQSKEGSLPNGDGELPPQEAAHHHQSGELELKSTAVSEVAADSRGQKEDPDGCPSPAEPTVPPAPAGKGSASGTRANAKGGKGGPPPPKAPPPLGRGKSGKGEGKKGETDDGMQDRDLRQPYMKPNRAMKALWWTRFEYGRHLQDGSSIWDHMKDLQLNVPTDLFEERFGKQTHQKSAGEAERRTSKGEGTTKELRICNDPNKTVGKEGALRGFPPAETIAQALMELDPLVLDPQRLATVKDHFCPLPNEVTQLEELRQENPTVPFAPPEHYMWHVSRVPAFRARVECWSFVNMYKERAASYATALAEFQQIEDSLLRSSALPQLLALILWVGNYLNGGTKRGRADGFDLETLNKLDSVKDNQSENGARDIRHFIFELFLVGTIRGAEAQMASTDQMEAAYQTGIQLLEDFIPLFRNVNRNLTRENGGFKKVVKNVRVVLEDVETDVVELQQLFTRQQERLLECLQHSDDPADPMKLSMAERFAEARPLLSRLEAQSKRCREGYSKLLAHFNHPGMKTNEFILLWDDFFIPGDLILNKPEALQKSEVLPYFCKPNVTPSLDNLLVLWDLRTPEEVCEAAALRRRRAPPKRPPRQQRAAPHMAPAVSRCAQHWKTRISSRASPEPGLA